MHSITKIGKRVNCSRAIQLGEIRKEISLLKKTNRSQNVKPILGQRNFHKYGILFCNSKTPKDNNGENNNNNNNDNPFRKSRNRKLSLMNHIREVTYDLENMKLEDVIPYVKTFRKNVLSSLLKLSIIDPKEYTLESDKIYPADPSIDRILDINSFLHLQDPPSTLLSGERGYSSVFNRIGFSLKGPVNSQNYMFSLALQLARRHNAKLIDFDVEFFNKALTWHAENKHFDKPIEEFYHEFLVRLNSVIDDDPFIHFEDLVSTVLNDPNEKYIILLRNYDPNKLGTSGAIIRGIWDVKSPTLFLNLVLENNKTAEENDQEETFMVQFPADFADPKSPTKIRTIVTAPSIQPKKNTDNTLNNLFGFEAIDISQRFMNNKDKKEWERYLTQLNNDINLFDNTRSFRACLKILNINLVDKDGNILNDSFENSMLKDYLRTRRYDKSEIMLIVKNAIKMSAMDSYIVSNGAIKEVPQENLLDDFPSLQIEDHLNNIKEYSNHGFENKNSSTLNEAYICEAFELLMSNLETTSPKTSKKDIESLLTPTEKKVYENYVDPDKIETTFDDIGSLTQAKDELLSLLVPLRLKAFQNNKLIKSPTGILLYGPPGTGKTMLAKALARSAGASFIHISASSILSKWLGESEDNTAAIFSLARKLSPSIIFIDEVDGLLQTRDVGEHESSRRVKNEFFSGWDGLFSNTTDSGQVTVICATNRPYDLDSAALRRLPHRVLVPLPDKAARREIFAKQLKHTKIAKEWRENEENISEEERNEVLDILAEKTERYSGSDIRSVCVRAALQLVRDFMSDSEKLKKEEENNDSVFESLALKHAGRPITLKEFDIALNEIMPSVDPKSKTQLELLKWHQTYGHKEEKKRITTVGF